MDRAGAQGISENRKLARKIFMRLTGVGIPIDHPTLLQMEYHIGIGNLMAAAEIATRDKNFYNITVRDFASQMTTRDETIKTDLNDMTAAFIGVTRDNLSAKTLLTGNFYYAADPNIMANNQELVEDFLVSGDHYRAIDSLTKQVNGVTRKVYPHEVLVRIDGQMAAGGNSENPQNITVVPHPNPAGVLTSRAFMEAHAVMGTNRRIIEYAFREFACYGIENIADNENPTDMIGRDVSREPGGDNQEFKSSCQACHTQMDSLRPAFARVNFENSIVKWSEVYTGDRGVWDINDPNSDQSFDPATGVINKMIRFADAARLSPSQDPPGYVITTEGGVGRAPATAGTPIPFKLRSNNNANSTLFGWRADPAQGGKPLDAGFEPEGTRIADLGRWLANSKQFSRCMTQRAFQQVCNRTLASDERNMLNQLSNEFEAKGYKLKSLFQSVAVTPQCLRE